VIRFEHSSKRLGRAQIAPTEAHRRFGNNVVIYGTWRTGYLGIQQEVDAHLPGEVPDRLTQGHTVHYDLGNSVGGAVLRWLGGWFRGSAADENASRRQ